MMRQRLITIIIRKLASLDERGFVTTRRSQSMLRLRRNRRVRFPRTRYREFKKKSIVIRKLKYESKILFRIIIITLLNLLKMCSCYI